MSDSNNKDPLEEFFQKKSGDYDISYREEDWKSLEGRLDALDAQIAARRRRRLAAAAVLIIISLLSYFIYQNNQEINSLNEQLSRQDQPQTITNPVPDSATEDALTENSTPVPDLKDVKEDPNNGKLEGNSQNERLENRVGETGAELATDINSDQYQTIARNKTNPISISEINCEECILSETITQTPTEFHSISANETYATDRNTPIAQLTGLESSQEETQRINSSKSALSRITLGFVLGPDMSTAGNFSNFYNPGSKIGVTVDYSISEKWAVSIGAIRSKVNYKAGSSDYSPPAGYWYNGVEADLTRAACILIDIPVNLSYRFFRRNHSRLYASAGLSSYIMVNEDYRFSYAYEQPELPQRWKENTGTKHFMSNANIAIGYEYELTNSLSLRAEPFLRVPIREIGWGNVDLYSVGSLFSINYSLNKL